MDNYNSHMKHLIVIISFCACFAACTKSEGFLENKTTSLDENLVFSDSLRTIQFLNGVYGDIGFTFNKRRWDTHGNTEQSTDDAEYSLSVA